MVPSPVRYHVRTYVMTRSTPLPTVLAISPVSPGGRSSGLRPRWRCSLGWALALGLSACQGGRDPAGAPQHVGGGAAAAGALAPHTGATAGDVALLASQDFALRSAAAERLVSAGRAALPALGEAGDMPLRGPGGDTSSSTQPVVAAILVRLEDGELVALLESNHASLRRGAATEIGQRSAWAPIPRLIERLDDRDAGVREAAHAALRRLTNEFLEPQAGRGQGVRASLTERWRQWWQQVGRARSTQPAGLAPA